MLALFAVQVLRDQSVGFFSSPLDHGFWWPVQEYQFGIEVFLQLQLSCLPDEKYICAQLQDSVHIRELFKHNGVRDPTEEFTNKFPNYKDNGCVQSHDTERDSEGKRWRWLKNACWLCFDKIQHDFAHKIQHNYMCSFQSISFSPLTILSWGLL